LTLTQHSITVITHKAARTVGKRSQPLIFMCLVTLALMGGITSRLAYLQLFQGERHRQLAENNRVRLIPRPPERGKILDRKGKVLVGNRISYSVFLWPVANRESDWQPVIQKLSDILDIPAEQIQNKLIQAGYYSPSLVRIAKGLNPSQLTALAESNQVLEGVQIQAEAVRYYPHGEVAAHVLGYTGELSEQDLKSLQGAGYRLGDIIGQMGVEAAFESYLRGEWGGQQVEVDGMGKVIRVLGEKPSQSGRDIALTLDLELQQAAEIALGDRKGAIVAIDPRNGAVRAMVSRPTFDPNLFSKHITNAQWLKLQSQEFPFLNRALQGYPPASTFKIVTTTAAIESGRYPIHTVLRTFPFLTIGGNQFWDWNRAGFGPLDFTGAMAWSSDTFFYQTAVGMGAAPLIEWTRRYGFGQKTGIEIGNEEAAGLVPDETWKQQEVKEPWYVGDTVNMSIGQGFLQASPLQVAVMFAVVANGGDRVQPHLLKDYEESRSWRTSLNLQPDTLETLQEGLRGVITYGTGKALNVPHLPSLAGKSGTAEDPPRESHTWFGAYGPIDHPEIVVVAFGENSGGGGGSVTAPMVLQVLESYFNHTVPQAAATDAAAAPD